MERETRFELATLALARRCSTTELLPLDAILSIPGGRNVVKPPSAPDLRPVQSAREADETASRREPFSSRTISPSRIYRIRLAIGGRLGIVRDHQRRLPQFTVRLEQHLQHRRRSSSYPDCRWARRPAQSPAA